MVNQNKTENLSIAKKNKNDEFYTQIEDIEKELKHYTHHFKDKVIYCNCDNPKESEFYRYFKTNFDSLGLKKLIATYYEEGEQTYKIECYGLETEDVITPLLQNGDFRSDECVELLKECDVAVTNPPFSCYSSDTEVMTNNGWKLINDVNIEKDMIWSLNPYTDKMEWVKAVDKIKQHISDDIMHFESRGMDLMVTKNHKMYAHSSSAKKKLLHDDDNTFISAENLSVNHSLKTKGFTCIGEDTPTFILPGCTQVQQYTNKEIFAPEKEIEMMAWLEFFGFWLADGSTRQTKNVHNKPRHVVSIKQHKDNIEYVKALCENIGFEPKIYKSGQTTANIEINSKQLWLYLSQFGRSGDKYIPKEFLHLDKKYLEKLFNGYKNGDSTRINDTYTIYSSKSEQLMIDIQFIILCLYGQVVQIRTDNAKYKQKPYTYFKIAHTHNGVKNISYTRYPEPKLVKYDDFVHCLTLERNHIMLVRRNKKIAFSGNCFREFIPLLEEYGKKYIVMGNNNAITYKGVFKLIRDNKLWLGYNVNKTMTFEVPPTYKFVEGKYTTKDGKYYIKVPAISWFTNLEISKRNKPISLCESYNPELYPKYDNYSAIEVSKVKNIPKDYDGIMGVPITFLDKYNPEQFEIINTSSSLAEPIIINGKRRTDRFYINGRRLYDRIVIRKRPTWIQE